MAEFPLEPMLSKFLLSLAPASIPCRFSLAAPLANVGVADSAQVGVADFACAPAGRLSTSVPRKP
eukprot:2964915-Rhodomonas_salina.1